MNIVVSFSTIASRIDRIKPMIDSINCQTVKPDRFILWLPERCKKQNKKYEIPSWLDGLVEIKRCKKDWGSATKLIPSLYEFDDPETIIITVDDDIAYEKHTIEELLKCSKKLPNASIGFMGQANDGLLYHAEFIEKPKLVKMLGGYRSILYKRGFFNKRILDEIEWIESNGVFIADDQFFASHLASNSIECYISPTNYCRKKTLDSKNKKSNLESMLNFDFLHLGDGIFDGNENKEEIQRSLSLIDKASKIETFT